MSRKRCRRRVWLPLPRRELRAKLSRDQVRDLATAHIANLDLVAKGQGTEALLWDTVGAVLLWSKVAEQLQAGVDEMLEQVRLATSMVQRYGRTGRVGFSGPEYQLAKRGVEVMDQLAEMVDHPTAVMAAAWSEAMVQVMAEEMVRLNAGGNGLGPACRDKSR